MLPAFEFPKEWDFWPRFWGGSVLGVHSTVMVVVGDGGGGGSPLNLECYSTDLIRPSQ